jgi:LmbE family N-acetylglucosaminyl deacetylase
MRDEASQIPYQSSSVPKVERVLVLAPHADDEVFGCGGALALHALSNGRVHVIIATDGAARHDDAQFRLKESATAAQVLGIPSPTCWHLPDRGLRFDEDLVARILHEMKRMDPQLIYAPWPGEIHPDHHALAMASIEAVRRSGASAVKLALFEVAIPLTPTHLVDITPVWQRKQDAMRCFESQLTHQAYDQQITGLNRFRSYTLGSRVMAAEAFVLTDGEQLARGHWPRAQTLNSESALAYFAPSAATSPPLLSEPQILAEMMLMKSSRSWRWTAPLRWLLRSFRKWNR